MGSPPNDATSVCGARHDLSSKAELEASTIRALARERSVEQGTRVETQDRTAGNFAIRTAKGELGFPSDSVHTGHSCGEHDTGLMPGGREDQCD